MDKYILLFIHLEMYNFTEPFQGKKKKKREPKASEIQKIIYCLVSCVLFFEQQHSPKIT